MIYFSQTQKFDIFNRFTVSGVCSFCWYCVESQKTECVGATESQVWIGNFNVKARKTIKQIVPKTCAPHNFAKFRQNEQQHNL